MHVCFSFLEVLPFPSRHTSLLISILGGTVFAIMTHMFVHLFLKALCLSSQHMCLFVCFLLPLPLPSSLIGDLNCLFG